MPVHHSGTTSRKASDKESQKVTNNPPPSPALQPAQPFGGPAGVLEKVVSRGSIAGAPVGKHVVDRSLTHWRIGDRFGPAQSTLRIEVGHLAGEGHAGGV